MNLPAVLSSIDYDRDQNSTSLDNDQLSKKAHNTPSGISRDASASISKRESKTISVRNKAKNRAICISPDDNDQFTSYEMPSKNITIKSSKKGYKS